MNRWFRVYDSLADDPKVQRLPDPLFRALINLWCLASRNGGFLPAPAEVAFTLRLTVVRVNKILAELRTALLLDEADGRLRPHNWDGRQFKSDRSNDRVAALRERRRNGLGNVTDDVTSAVTATAEETPPESETESEADSNLSLPISLPREGEGGIKKFVEEFLNQYPQRNIPIAPDPIRRAMKIALLKADRPTILAAATRFAEAMRKAGKFGSQYVPKPENWLAEQGWEAYPAPSPNGVSPADALAAATDPRWTPVRERLVAQLGADIVASWFSRARLISIDAGLARIAMPTRFIANWVTTNYRDVLHEAFRHAHGAAIERVEVLDGSRPLPAPQADGEEFVARPVDRAAALAAQQELTRQTVLLEGADQVAGYLGVKAKLPAIPRLTEWATTLGNDWCRLAQILADAKQKRLGGEAALGWIGQQVKTHAASNVLMHKPVEVKPGREGAAEPIGRRGRRRRQGGAR